jgi:hypothetical protein
MSGCAHLRGGATLRARFADDELFALLSAMHYRPEHAGDGMIVFDMQRSKVALINQWDGDLQMYFGVTGGAWDIGRVNDWNRTRRLSRAYLDDRADLVLEADLLASPGLTAEQVRSFVALFEDSLSAFIREVATQPDAGVPRPDGQPVVR